MTRIAIDRVVVPGPVDRRHLKAALAVALAGGEPKGPDREVQLARRIARAVREATDG